MSSNPERKNKPPAGSPPARRFLLYWFPLLALCTAIFWQSCYPSQISSVFTVQDKFLHLAAYGLMAFLAARALKAERPGISDLWLRSFAMGFAILFGLSDEIHQAFVPGRCASLGDWVADILGAGIGAWIFIGMMNRSVKGNPHD